MLGGGVLMARHNRPNALSTIPPFIDQWGNPTYENPWGQNRPNPALKAALTQHETQYERDTKTDEHAYTGRTVEQINERRARMRRRLQRAVAVVTVSIGVFSASTAYAVWSTHGTGSGTSKATTLQQLTATGSVSSAFLPDSTTRNVNLTVNNPNPFQVKIISVTANGSPSGSGGTGTCTTTGVTFTNQTNLSILISANASNVNLPLTGAASMSIASDPGCQSATITIPVTIAVQTP
jgi:hypothetical protein